MAQERAVAVQRDERLGGALLRQVDLLIDGPFIQRLNDDRGLRGSSNQSFIHLSPRLAHLDFASLPRKVEVHLLDGEAFLVGIPPAPFLSAWEQALLASAPPLAAAISSAGAIP